MGQTQCMFWLFVITCIAIPSLLYLGFTTKPGITIVLVLSVGLVIGLLVGKKEGRAAALRETAAAEEMAATQRTRPEPVVDSILPPPTTRAAKTRPAAADSPVPRPIAQPKPTSTFADWRPGMCPRLALMQEFQCRDELASRRLSNLCRRWVTAQQQHGQGAIVVPPGAPSCVDGRPVAGWTVLSSR